MDNTEEVKKGGSMKVVIVVIVIAILVAVAYFAFGRKAAEVKVVGVATVNGVVIPKTEYDTQLAAAIKAQNIDATNATAIAQVKTQVMDNLVSTELVNQGIKAAGIKATPDEIEKQFQAILTQTGGADKLKEELIKANITEGKLRENIAKQLDIQAYLLKNINVAGITVTDAEVAQFYAEYSKAQKATNAKAVVPTLKDLSAQIKQQITANKQQTLVSNFVASLKAGAKIEITPNL